MKRVRYSNSYIKAQKQRKEERDIAKQRILADTKYNIYNMGFSKIYWWEEEYIDDIIKELGVRIVKVKEVLILDRKHLIKLYKLSKLFGDLGENSLICAMITVVISVILIGTTSNNLACPSSLLLCFILTIASIVLLHLENIYYDKFNKELKQQVMLLGKYDKHYADRLLEKGYILYWDEVRNKYVVGDIDGEK